jgi:hypothetical protein
MIRNILCSMTLFSLGILVLPSPSLSRDSIQIDSRSKNIIAIGLSSSQKKSKDVQGYAIQGNLTLIDSDIRGNSRNCYGSGGYDDIQSNMPVTVYDAAGKIIAVGNTGSGHQPTDSEYASVQCVFEFKVDNIPKSDFYSIEVGRRGKLNYSFNEIQAKKWNVEFSLSRR